MASRVLAVIIAMIAGTLCAGDEPVMNNDTNRIRFTFSDKEIIVSMVENSAVRACPP